MALLGYQFDKMRVDPSADALLYNYLNGNNNGVIPTYKDGMKVTASGLVLTILPGACIIEGRLIVLTEPQAVTVPVDSGKILALTVDLSKLNTSTGDPIDSSYIVTNNQIKFELRDNVDASNQDLNNGGTVYSQSLGTYETSGTTANWTENTEFYAPYTGASLFDKLARANTVYAAYTNSIDDTNWFAMDDNNKTVVHNDFTDVELIVFRVGGLVTMQFRGTARAGAQPRYKYVIHMQNGFRVGKTADHFSVAMADYATGNAPWCLYQLATNFGMNASSAAAASHMFGVSVTYTTNDDYPDAALYANTAHASSGIKYPIF